MWGMYWKLHDKRKRLAASLKGYLDGLPPETRRRIVLGMFAAFAVLALYTFGRAVYDIGRNDGHIKCTIYRIKLFETCWSLFVKLCPKCGTKSNCCFYFCARVLSNKAVTCRK